MDVINRLFGYVHYILGLVIAAHFLAPAVYDDDVAQLWEVFDYVMAIGVISALVFSYLRARNADRSDLQEWIASILMLIASAGLFLLFFEQWFATEIFKDEGDELGDFRSLIWIVVDIMFVIVNIIVGSYLLRIVGATYDD